MRKKGLLALVGGAFAAIGALLLWAPAAVVVSAPTAGDSRRPPTIDVSRRAAPAAPAETSRGQTVGLWLIAADTGEPIAGARVRQTRPWLELTSDVRGAVLLDEAQALAAVEISAPFMKTRSGTFGAAETVELSRLPVVHGLVLTGRSTPVAGAVVTSMTEPFAQTTTDAAGQFELRVAAYGPIAARSGEMLGTSSFRESEGDDERVFIVLSSNPAVEGLVVDGAQRPIEGAVITLSAGAIVERQVTDALGRWKVPAWQVEVDLNVSKTSYLPYSRKRPSHHPWEAPFPRVIRLSRPATLSGVLRTPEGGTVDGATVTCSGSTQVVLSGPEGRFTFDALPPGSNTLTAMLGSRSGEKQVDLLEGASARAVVVLQPELIDVPLVLVDELGRETPCFDGLATPMPPQEWTSSYDRARGVLPLQRGRFRIEVTAEDGASGDSVVEVDPRPGMPALRLMVHHQPEAAVEAEPPPQVLTVKVKDSGGVSVGGALVDCGGAQGLTREDGTFACQLSPFLSRPVRVTAKKALASGMAAAFGQERELELIVRPARVIRGTISGPLRPGARHHLELNSVFERTEVPLTAHEFVLTDKSPVRTSLCVNDEQNERRGCTVVHDEQEVTIPVGPPGAFTVTILDEKGAPLEAPVLYLNRRTELPAAPQGVATVTAAPGIYVLIINARGTTARAEVLVTVRSGQTTQLGTLQLK